MPDNTEEFKFEISSDVEGLEKAYNVLMKYNEAWNQFVSNMAKPVNMPNLSAITESFENGMKQLTNTTQGAPRGSVDELQAFGNLAVEQARRKVFPSQIRQDERRMFRSVLSVAGDQQELDLQGHERVQNLTKQTREEAAQQRALQRTHGEIIKRSAAGQTPEQIASDPIFQNLARQAMPKSLLSTPGLNLESTLRSQVTQFAQSSEVQQAIQELRDVPLQRQMIGSRNYQFAQRKFQETQEQRFDRQQRSAAREGIRQGTYSELDRLVSEDPRFQTNEEKFDRKDQLVTEETERQERIKKTRVYQKNTPFRIAGVESAVQKSIQRAVTSESGLDPQSNENKVLLGKLMDTGQYADETAAQARIDAIKTEVETKHASTQAQKSSQSDLSRLKKQQSIDALMKADIKKGAYPFQNKIIRASIAAAGLATEPDAIDKYISEREAAITPEVEQEAQERADRESARQARTGSSGMDIEDRKEALRLQIGRHIYRRGGSIVNNVRFRRRYEKMYPESTEEEITEGLEDFTQQAKEGNYTNPRARGLIHLLGTGFSLPQTFAVNQIAQDLGALGTQYAGAAGSGQPWMPQQHMGDLLGGIGTLSALIPGWGFQGIALGMGLKALGGISDAYVGGQQQLATAYSVAQNTTGFQDAFLQNTAKQIGNLEDPTQRNYLSNELRKVRDSRSFQIGQGLLPHLGPLGFLSSLALGAGMNYLMPNQGKIGEAPALDLTTSLNSLRMAGLSDQDIGTLSKQYAGDVGTKAGQAMAQNTMPFFMDPLFSSRYLSNVPGSSNPRNTIQGDFSSTPAIIETLIGHGAPETMAALESSGNKNLINPAMSIFRSLARLTSSETILGSQAGTVQSRQQEVLATGVSYQSGTYKQTQENVISSLQKQKDAIDSHIAILKESGDKTGKTGEQIAALGMQSQQLGTQIQSAKQSYAIQVATEKSNVAEALSARAGYQAQLQGFGLQAGTVAPALATQAKDVQGQITVAEANANNMLLPYATRVDERTKAESLRVGLVSIAREQFSERYSAPAEQARGFLSRQEAERAQAQTFGYGEETLLKMTGTSLQMSASTIEKEKLELAQTNIEFNKKPSIETWKDLETARNALEGTQLQRNQMIEQQARYPTQEILRKTGYTQQETGAFQQYLQMLKPGPEEELTASKGLAATFRSQATALEQQAADVLKANPLDTATAEGLRSQAKLASIQAQSTTLAGYEGYQPSAKTSLALQQGSLGISLAEGDIATGGMVPTSMRRAQFTNLMQEVGNLNSRIQNTPDDLKDAVAASLEPMKASLLQQAQEQYQKIQYGDIGHVTNLLAGSSGYSVFTMPTVAEFQRINPRGSMLFGGTGEDVGMSPFSQMAYQPTDGVSGYNRPQTVTDALGNAVGPQSPVLAQLDQAHRGGGAQTQAVLSDPQTHAILLKIAQSLDEIAKSAKGGAGVMIHPSGGSVSASNPLVNQGQRNSVSQIQRNLASGNPINQ